MKQIIYIYTRIRNAFRPASRECEWSSDPLSHPAIRAMDMGELADLPFSSMRSSRCN